MFGNHSNTLHLVMPTLSDARKRKSDTSTCFAAQNIKYPKYKIVLIHCTRREGEEREFWALAWMKPTVEEERIFLFCTWIPTKNGFNAWFFFVHRGTPSLMSIFCCWVYLFFQHHYHTVEDFRPLFDWGAAQKSSASIKGQLQCYSVLGNIQRSTSIFALCIQISVSSGFAICNNRFHNM